MYLYVASPYSHPDASIVADRYTKTETLVATLLRQGVSVYSPIVHCHYLALAHDLPTDAEYWQRYNERMLSPARKLVVIQLDGWSESIGVRGEIRYAMTHCKPILYRKPIEILAHDYTVDDYML